MALAPADFYAYSRATGVPVPEDPEERAALAPEVLEFRRNQLRAPQQESNPLAALGATALGVGALVGGIAAAKGLRRADKAFTIPRPASQAAGTQEEVRKIDAFAKQRAAEALERKARQERPQGLVLTNIPQAEELAAAFGDLPQPTQQELNRALNAPAQKVYRPKGGLEDVVSSAEEAKVLLTDPQTGEIFRRGRSPQGFAERYISLRPALTGQKTDLPTGRTPSDFRTFSRDVSGEAQVDALLNDPELKTLIAQQKRAEGAELGREAQRQMRIASAIEAEADQYLTQLRQQTAGAFESGEDQITGRTMRGVQRNEDLDTSQVNAAARQTGSAKVAASLTPDGVPVDQTDVSLSTATKQEQAQSFLSQKRQELSSQFTPTRVERILGQNPELIEAAELYASTGDPSVLSRFSQTPSSPITVKPAVQMGINQEEFPTGQFYKKTGYPENTGDLLERDIELTNEISSIGEQQQQLATKAQELGEQELMLRAAMDRDPEGGGAYTRMFGKVKFEQQNLPEPASLNVDLGDALAERDFVRQQIKSLESLGSTYKLGDFQEGVRPFYEYDPQGNIIPQTLELRGGRRSVDLDPKTGGGRLVAEYDPEGQTGSTRGVYGVEQTSRRSGESTRPTQMTMNELVREGIGQASASPEGDVPIPPSLEQMTERRPTAAARRSIETSQALRQATIEGRNPQDFLAKQMQDLGISAIGEFSPWPRRTR